MSKERPKLRECTAVTKVKQKSSLFLAWSSEPQARASKKLWEEEERSPKVESPPGESAANWAQTWAGTPAQTAADAINQNAIRKPFSSPEFPDGNCGKLAKLRICVSQVLPEVEKGILKLKLNSLGTKYFVDMTKNQIRVSSLSGIRMRHRNSGTS